MTININYTLTERTELDSDYRHLDAKKQEFSDSEYQHVLVFL